MPVPCSVSNTGNSSSSSELIELVEASLAFILLLVLSISPVRGFADVVVDVDDDDVDVDDDDVDVENINFADPFAAAALRVDAEVAWHASSEISSL